MLFIFCSFYCRYCFHPLYIYASCIRSSESLGPVLYKYNVSLVDLSRSINRSCCHSPVIVTIAECPDRDGEGLPYWVQCVLYHLRLVANGEPGNGEYITHAYLCLRSTASPQVTTGLRYDVPIIR